MLRGFTKRGQHTSSIAAMFDTKVTLSVSLLMASERHRRNYEIIDNYNETLLLISLSFFSTWEEEDYGRAYGSQEGSSCSGCPEIH
jgi:hypothetical protein